MSTINSVTPQTVPQRISGPKGVRFLPPEGHRNIMLTLSYDGKDFSGYQFQPHARTVQEEINKAWKILCGEDVTLYGCSRLDTDVCANHFVLNFYTASALDCERIVRGLNGIFRWNLNANISIYRAAEAAPDFNSRFDSVGKHYRYLLWYGYGQHALLTPKTWVVKGIMDPLRVPHFGRQFEGTHNFSAFRASDCCAKNTIKTIYKFDVWRHPRFSELWIADIWGEGFLKNMIRNLIGTAVDAAQGKFSADDISNAFIHGKREKMGQCGPGSALTLEKVFYNAEELQAEFSAGARHTLPSSIS